jgi:hypothetical protein
MKGPLRSNRRNWTFRVIVVLFLALILAFLGWSSCVYVQIENYAGMDQATPSNAIGVLGAAECDGRPSPVFCARLDHARELYNRGIAPLIITLGGTSGDEYSEGAVGPRLPYEPGRPRIRHYRRNREPKHRGTGPPIAVIARTNGLRRLVVVSDRTLLFRIHEICAADGLDVLTSPRTRVSVGGRTAEAERIAHEILGYTAWRLQLHLHWWS